MVGLAALSLAAVTLTATAAAAGAVGNGSISGTVTFDDTGAVPSDAQVCALPLLSGPSVCVPVDPTTGAYEISGLEAGDYELTALSPTNEFVQEYYYDAYQPAGGFPVFDFEPSVRDFAVAPGGVVKGTVTLEGTGEPVAGLEVCALGVFDRCATTEADGSYSLGPLTQDPFTIVFGLYEWGQPTAQEFWSDQPDLASAETITLTSPTQVLTGIDAEVALAGSVSGVVTDSETGEPLDTYSVCFQHVLDALPTCFPYTQEYRDFLGLPPGAYSIPGVRPGDYTVTFIGDSSHRGEYWDDQPLSGPPGQLTVISGGAIEADAALAPLHGVFGKVLESYWSEPLTDQTVCVYQGASVLSCVTTTPDGSFEFPDLPAGSYSLGVQGTYEFLAQFWENADSLDTAQSFEVVDGVDNEPFVFRLEYGWGLPEVTTTTGTTSTTTTASTTTTLGTAVTTATSIRPPAENSGNSVTTSTAVPTTRSSSTTTVVATVQPTTSRFTPLLPRVLGEQQHASAPRAQTGRSVAPVLALGAAMFGFGLVLVLAERRRARQR